MIESVKKRMANNKAFLFILELIRRFVEDRIPQMGAMLAYHLFMSIFPFLIFFLNVLSYTPLLQVDVVNDMMEFVPYETQAILQPILLDLVRSRSSAILSLSLILALWSGSNALNQVIRIMNRAFDIPDSRSFIRRRALAIVYTVLLSLMLIIMLLGPVFGDAILSGLFSIIGPRDWIASIWGWFKSAIPLTILIIGFALLYRNGPAFPKESRIKFRDALIGAAVAAIGWLVASSGFSFYVNNFSNYSNTYGSLAGIIILMIWLYLSAIILLLGAEIAATIYFMRTQPEDRPTVYELIKEHSRKQ